MWYIELRIDDDLCQILVPIFCAMICESRYMVTTMQQIAQKVFQPQPMTRRWEGTHKENIEGRRRDGHQQCR